MTGARKVSIADGDFETAFDGEGYCCCVADTWIVSVLCGFGDKLGIRRIESRERGSEACLMQSSRNPESHHRCLT